jgi:hypothetical protein
MSGRQVVFYFVIKIIFKQFSFFLPCFGFPIEACATFLVLFLSASLAEVSNVVPWVLIYFLDCSRIFLAFGNWSLGFGGFSESQRRRKRLFPWERFSLCWRLRSDLKCKYHISFPTFRNKQLTRWNLPCRLDCTI